MGNSPVTRLNGLFAISVFMPVASVIQFFTLSEDEIDANDFSDDPVDKIFSVFFGKKEDEPMGMKRFGREKFPEHFNFK